MSTQYPIHNYNNVQCASRSVCFRRTLFNTLCLTTSCYASCYASQPLVMLFALMLCFLLCRITSCYESCYALMSCFLLCLTTSCYALCYALMLCLDVMPHNLLLCFICTTLSTPLHSQHSALHCICSSKVSLHPQLKSFIAFAIQNFHCIHSSKASLHSQLKSLIAFTAQKSLPA